MPDPATPSENERDRVPRRLTKETPDGPTRAPRPGHHVLRAGSCLQQAEREPVADEMMNASIGRQPLLDSGRLQTENREPVRDGQGAGPASVLNRCHRRQGPAVRNGPEARHSRRACVQAHPRKARPLRFGQSW